MNKFEAERRFAQRMKDNYPPGTRILLLSMGDNPRPIEDNTKGTVKAVDDMGTLHCDFDNGRHWIYTKKVDKCDIIKNTKNKTSKERKKCQKKVRNIHRNLSKRL